MYPYTWKNRNFIEIWKKWNETIKCGRPYTSEIKMHTIIINIWNCQCLMNFAACWLHNFFEDFEEHFFVLLLRWNSHDHWVFTACLLHNFFEDFDTHFLVLGEYLVKFICFFAANWLHKKIYNKKNDTMQWTFEIVLFFVSWKLECNFFQFYKKFTM